jgi:glycosyltransferase involved in cell wall biosynthesis
VKILMICEFYDPKLAYQENFLSKFYVSRGHDVVVITSTFENVFDYYADRHDASLPRSEFDDGGARIIRLPYRYNLMNRLRAYVSISEIMSEFAPDMIFIHDIIPNIPEIIRYKKKNRNVRVVMDYHADYSNSGKNWLSLAILHGVVRKFFLDHARPHLAAIFPVVPASTTFLREVYKVPDHEMEVLPLGADIAAADHVRATTDRAQLRASFGIAGSDFVVFTGGKLDAKKQTEKLIKAVKLCGADCHLIVVGQPKADDVAYQDVLTSAAAGSPNIHFAGWLTSDDVLRHMSICDIAVFPASQSVIWQQAISMGLPVIAGDAGYQDSSYLNRHDNLITLAARDIEVGVIARHIERLKSDDGLRAKMGEGALRTAAEFLDWNRIARRTLDVDLKAERRAGLQAGA